MIKHITIEMGAYSALKLVSSESGGGFDNGAFAVYPPRFYGIEPGAELEGVRFLPARALSWQRRESRRA